MSTNNTLKIGEKTLEFNKLKMGQTIQLQELFGFDVMKGFNVEKAKKEFKKDLRKIAKLIAIVCKEKNVPLEKKNIEELSNYILFNWEVDDMNKALSFFNAVSKKNSKKPSRNRGNTASSRRRKKRKRK